jgi:hypothetical protein
VYDYVHGPQPQVRGRTLLYHEDEAVWKVRRGAASETVTATWRGYRFEGDRVFLQYELPGANGTPIQISECPEATMDDDGTYVLTRTFETSNVPEGWVINVALSTRQDSDLHLTYTSGETVVPMNDANRAAGGPDYQSLRFTLTANGTKSITARMTNSQGGAR